MAILKFVHGTMTSGKTTSLLQDAHNLKCHGLMPYLLTASGDVRSGMGVIASRIGISAPAEIFSPKENIYEKIRSATMEQEINQVMVDECQFLSRDQVFELSDVVDELGIAVTCYGLRSDFRGELFEGSAALMVLADALVENTGICASGAPANMVIRIDDKGGAMLDGPQVLVGGEESYQAVSRAVWKKKVRLSMAVNASKAGTRKYA